LTRTTDTALKKAFAARLKSLIGRATQGDFAATTGMKAKTVNKLVTAKSIPGGLNLVKIVRATGVNGHWLLTGQGPMWLHGDPGDRPDSPRLVTVRFLSGDVAAGQPHSTVEDVDVERLPVPLNLIADPETCRALHITGSSMGEVIPAGSVAVVDLTQNRVGDLDGAVVCVSLPDAQGLVVKRLRLNGDGIVLESEDRRYGEVRFDPGVLHPNMIVGRVVAIWTPEGEIRKV